MLLSCCKCLLDYIIKANLGNIQPDKRQNVQKRGFWPKNPGGKGLKELKKKYRSWAVVALTALFLIAVFGVTSCGWSCGGRVSPTQLYRRNATSPGGENSFPNLSPTHVHDKLSCGRGNKVMQFVGCGTQCWMKQTRNKEKRKAQNKQIKNQNQTRVSNQTWNTFKSRHSALKPFNFFLQVITNGELPLV